MLPTGQQNPGMQNEPQNLKIKQENDNTPSTGSISNGENSTLIYIYLSLMICLNVAPTPPISSASSQPISDPLQSLKDVKVPGFSLPTSSMNQPIIGQERPSSGNYILLLYCVFHIINYFS